MKPKRSRWTDLEEAIPCQAEKAEEALIQMADVVRIAAIVPRGILRLGSRRSPLRFEPAMMP